MKVQQLYFSKYRVLGVLDQGACPCLDFLGDTDAATAAHRRGLAVMLSHVASNGFEDVPGAWTHEADKENGIYQFIKGPLRLFFFKGVGNSIAVCTGGTRKSGQKADPKSVQRAIKFKDEYMQAVKDGKLEVIEDEDH